MRWTLLILAFGSAFAQDSNVASTNATAQLVDISRFRMTHTRFSVRVQDNNMRSTEVNGQLPQYGGPIQYFVNTQSNFALHEVVEPFGASATLPVAHGRIELLGSAAGIFVPTATAWTRPNAWFTQATLGGRVALDPGHHFWVGGSMRYLSNFADSKRQHGLLSADFTFQSGH